MTRDEATNLLYQYKYFFENRRKRSRYTEQFAKALGIAIKSLSTENEWIPCSERLPKVGEQVLCCDSQSRVFTSALTEIASNGMTFFGKHCKVIAWMPLPKPYEKTNV